MRGPGWRGPRREWGAARLPFFDPQSAGCGPFLDAGEIVVSAVAARPHRQIERGIGLAFVLEFADQFLKLLSPVVSGGGRRLRLISRRDLEVPDLFLPPRAFA